MSSGLTVAISRLALLHGNHVERFFGISKFNKSTFCTKDSMLYKHLFFFCIFFIYLFIYLFIYFGWGEGRGNSRFHPTIKFMAQMFYTLQTCPPVCFVLFCFVLFRYVIVYSYTERHTQEMHWRWGEEGNYGVRARILIKRLFFAYVYNTYNFELNYTLITPKENRFSLSSFTTF